MKLAAKAAPLLVSAFMLVTVVLSPLKPFPVRPTPLCAPKRMPRTVAVLATPTLLVHLFKGWACGVLTAKRPRMSSCSCSCFLLRELWSWRLWAKATDLRLRRRLD